MDIENVRSFGAIGDGRTDDTEAFQKALDTLGSQGGGTLLIPNGIFMVSDLKVPSYVTLQCNPMWGYRIKAYGPAVLRLNRETAKCLLNLTDSTGVTLSGLSLDGSGLGEGVHGILVDKKGHGGREDALRIEKCRVVDFSGDGARLNAIWCFNVRSSMFAYHRGTGLCVHGWDGFVLDN